MVLLKVHLNKMKRVLKFCQWMGLGVVAIFALYWLSITLATELLRHREKTLDALTSIDAIKHWFFVMRLALYIGCYAACAWIMRRLNPEINAERFAQTRKLLIRFFIVYELFFGINVLALLLR